MKIEEHSENHNIFCCISCKIVHLGKTFVIQYLGTLSKSILGYKEHSELFTSLFPPQGAWWWGIAPSTVTGRVKQVQSINQ